MFWGSDAVWVGPIMIMVAPMQFGVVQSGLGRPDGMWKCPNNIGGSMGWSDVIQLYYFNWIFKPSSSALGIF